MLPNVAARQNASLSPRQTVALPYIASEPTLSEGARAARIAKMTLTRWMRDPAFRAELEHLQRNIAELALTKLEGLTLKSVIRLEQLLDDPDPRIRHRALKTALSTSLSVREQKDLRHRLDLIENAQVMMRQQR